MNDHYKAIIAEILKSYTPVSINSINSVADACTIESYKKGEIIFSEKKYNAFEYFQLEGISHRFNIDADNQMITTGIYVDKNVITPHFARTTEGRSIFSLQALTDCTFQKTPIGAFDNLRFTNEQLRAFGQRVVEKEFIQNLNYEVLFRSTSAKDRLLFFRSRYPSLENLIPHTIIASFLGITPVSFSRLRNELTKVK